MLQYSDRSTTGLAFLYRPFNDIDVYVEDTTIRNLYEVLINRILAGKGKVSRIFQLGGRDKVVDACVKDVASHRRRIYIIDGDTDVLLGTPDAAIPKLYRLRVFCCENLVVTESSVLEVAFESLANESKESVRRLLDYRKTMRDWTRQLRAFVAVCASAHIAEIGVPNLSENITPLIVKARGKVSLSPDKLKQKLQLLENAAQSSPRYDQFQRIQAEIRARFPKSTEDRAKLLPGKTILLPLVYHLLMEKGCHPPNVKSLCVRLARHCDLDVDNGLSEAIERTADVNSGTA